MTSVMEMDDYESKNIKEDEEDDYPGEYENLLSRDAIFAIDDREIALVKIPEWGGSVYVRVMTSHEKDAFDVSITDQKTKKVSMDDFRARLAAWTVCDAEGNLIFSKEDIQELTKKSQVPLDRIFSAARDINNMGSEAMKELVENFNETQTEDSGSSSL